MIVIILKLHHKKKDMKYLLLTISFFLFSHYLFSQNVGIGTVNPTEKLEVNGIVKANGLTVTQGVQYDVLKKGAANQLVFSKGQKGVGLNYIIALTGIFPGQGSSTGNYNNIFIGEIRLFAGNYPPSGFALCNGQLLSIATNSALFSVITTTYGGNGTTNFALPDLRGAVPVGFGTPTTGASWTMGEVN